jgi:acyl-CoA thioesterase
MDSTLSFLPLSLSNLPLTSARVVSSLDFSLRFHSPPPLNWNEDWLLLEQNTERAADGRTFSVGRMFTEDGVEIARMSQVSILRGPSQSKSVESKSGVSAKL